MQKKNNNNNQTRGKEAGHTGVEVQKQAKKEKKTLGQVELYNLQITDPVL